MEIFQENGYQPRQVCKLYMCCLYTDMLVSDVMEFEIDKFGVELGALGLGALFVVLYSLCSLLYTTACAHLLSCTSQGRCTRWRM